jgi:hypothetical protein
MECPGSRGTSGECGAPGRYSVGHETHRIDAAGHVYCVYRWSDIQPEASHHGAAIVVARIREDLLASGKATLADVEKRAACEITPSQAPSN